MRLSDEQLDAVVRRELQELSGQWHAPEPRSAVVACAEPVAARVDRPRRSGSLRPLAGAALVAVAVATLGLGIARPLLPDQRSGNVASPGGGPVRPAGDFPLGLTGGTLVWDEGSNSALLLVDDAQTWAWSASGGWQQLHTGAAPPPRTQGAMAYDPVDGSALLFGGAFGTTALADTWRWDGAQWRQLTPATTPAGGPALMCWDAASGRLLLVADFNAKDGSNTWTWTGATWQAAGPAPAGALRMAYDASAAAVVLVSRGGAGSAAATWEWRGGRWSRSGDAPPFATAVGNDATVQMTYDTTGGELLVVGPAFALRPQTWSWTPQTGWRRGAEIADQWAAGMAASPLGPLLFAGPNSQGAFAHGYRWDGARWIPVRG